MDSIDVKLEQLFDDRRAFALAIEKLAKDLHYGAPILPGAALYLLVSAIDDKVEELIELDGEIESLKEKRLIHEYQNS